MTEAKLRRAGKGKRLVIESGAEPEIDQNLVALIGEAFSHRTELLNGPDDSVEAMIERLGIARGRRNALVLAQNSERSRKPTDFCAPAISSWA